MGLRSLPPPYRGIKEFLAEASAEFQREPPASRRNFEAASPVAQTPQGDVNASNDSEIFPLIKSVPQGPIHPQPATFHISSPLTPRRIESVRYNYPSLRHPSLNSHHTPESRYPFDPVAPRLRRTQLRSRSCCEHHFSAMRLTILPDSSMNSMDAAPAGVTVNFSRASPFASRRITDEARSSVLPMNRRG